LQTDKGPAGLGSVLYNSYAVNKTIYFITGNEWAAIHSLVATGIAPYKMYGDAFVVAYGQFVVQKKYPGGKTHKG
jgi:hypothetical protein